MQNANLTEADRREICKAWDLSGYNQESIEGQLNGSKIIAVYPLFGMEYSRKKGDFIYYPGGLSIVFQQPGNPELKTLDITTQNACDRDDEITMGIENCYISPEPVYLLEGIK